MHEILTGPVGLCSVPIEGHLRHTNPPRAVCRALQSLPRAFHHQKTAIPVTSDMNPVTLCFMQILLQNVSNLKLVCLEREK